MKKTTTSKPALARFKRALRADESAMDGLTVMTMRRYLEGDFPAAIRWLMRHPKVGIALMQDAQELPVEVLDRLDLQAEKRSEKIKEKAKPKEKTKP